MPCRPKTLLLCSSEGASGALRPLLAAFAVLCAWRRLGPLDVGPPAFVPAQQCGRREAWAAVAGTAACAGAPQARAGVACDDECLAGLVGDFKVLPADPVDANDVRNQDKVSGLYGYIKPDGVRRILSRLDIREDDVFTDLGSGVGNIVLQVFAQTPVRRARGIEFLLSRHQRAAETQRRYEAKFGREAKRELLYVNGDITKDSYADSTIVFANSVAFYPNMMRSMKELCEANRNLRYLITYRRIEEQGFEQEPTTLRYLGEVCKVVGDFARKGICFQVYSNVPGVELKPEA